MKTKERKISPQLANKAHRASRIISEFQRDTSSESAFVDSQLVIHLTDETFEKELATVQEHVQLALRVIYQELPTAQLSMNTQSEYGVELFIFDPTTRHKTRVLVVSTDAGRDSVVKQLAPKKLSLSQAKSHLLAERIIVLVSPPRASYEKVSKSFFAEYETL